MKRFCLRISHRVVIFFSLFFLASCRPINLIPLKQISAKKPLTPDRSLLSDSKESAQKKLLSPPKRKGYSEPAKSRLMSVLSDPSRLLNRTPPRPLPPLKPFPQNRPSKRLASTSAPSNSAGNQKKNVRVQRVSVSQRKSINKLEKESKKIEKKSENMESSDGEGDSEEELEGFRLEELIRRSLRFSPLVKAAREFVNSVRAREREAFWSEWWPRGQAMALVAPAPPARGDAVNSSTPYPASYSRLSEYGFLSRVELSLAWPLYTFHKLTFLRRAARAGVRAAQFKVQAERANWILLVKRAFFGLQYAESVLSLLYELDDYIAEARGKLKSKTDRLRLEVLRAQLLSRKILAKNSRRLAVSALKKLADLEGKGGEFSIAPAYLQPYSAPPKPLKYYLKLAEKNRPELLLLKKFLEVKSNILKARRRTWTPDFFIAGFLRWGYSSAADDQLSPFARDDFNFFETGLFLGMRWALDFPIIYAKIRREEAEFKALKYRYQTLKGAIAMEVEQKYRQLRSHYGAYRAYSRGKRAAQKWLTRSMLAYSSGLIGAKELADALKSAAETRAAYLEALYKTYLSDAILARATGADLKKYTDNSAGGIKK